MKRIIIAAAALTLATAVQANPSDPIDAATDSLIELCKKFALDKAWAEAAKTRYFSQAELSQAWVASVEARKCSSFLSGFSYGYLNADAEGLRAGKKICFPSEVSREQLIGVFLHWTDRHPELWHQMSGISIHQAFSEAWPCTATTAKGE